MLKPKSYLSKLEDIACHVTYYLPLSRFYQKLLNSYFPANFSLELHQAQLN